MIDEELTTATDNIQDNTQPATQGATQGVESFLMPDAGAEPQEELDPAVIAMMQADVTPPESIGAYEFDYGSDIESLTPEQEETDRTLRTWLQDASIPAEIGTAIAKDVNTFAGRVAEYTPEQHDIEARTSMAMLERVFGSRTEEMVGLARGLVAELDRKHGGRVFEFLDATGIGNCPGLIVQLAQHAERRALLSKAKGGKR